MTSRVQKKQASGTSATFDSSVTSGNLIVVAVRKDSTGVCATPTDNKSNTYLPSVDRDYHADANLSEFYAYNVTGGSSFQVTCSDAEEIHIVEYDGIITTDPLDKTAEADGFQITTSSTTATLSQADELVTGSTTDQGGGVFAAGSGYTGNDGAGARMMTEYKVVADTTAVEALFTGMGNTGAILCATYKSTLLAYEQEGFRFRNDDGSETTATWLAAQDANVTAPKATNIRLRILTDSANVDPPTKRLKLQYRKVGDDGWRDLKS